MALIDLIHSEPWLAGAVASRTCYILGVCDDVDAGTIAQPLAVRQHWYLLDLTGDDAQVSNELLRFADDKLDYPILLLTELTSPGLLAELQIGADRFVALGRTSDSLEVFRQAGYATLQTSPERIEADINQIEQAFGQPLTKRVEVVAYDPTWLDRFDEVRQHLLGILAGLDARIEHVGSTSVPGLDAKAILDIDLVLQHGASFEAAKVLLEANGYRHMGDLGIKGREAFKYHNKPQLMRHNLYVLAEDADELHRHLTFRNWLRSHPQDREAYAAAKHASAEQHPDDISAYIDAKSDLIFDIYKRSGLFQPEDLPEMARSVLINRYNLPVEGIICRSVQPGVHLCQAQTTQDTVYLLVWEQASSASGGISLAQSASDRAIPLPLPTASGQQLCRAPFIMFALFATEHDALTFFSSDLWKEEINL